MSQLNSELLKRLGVLGDREDSFDLGNIDTGSDALNYVISGKVDGGYPIGRLIEIYGGASTGKTLLLTHAIKAAQAKGYYTGMLDNEFSYDPEFATMLGVDNSILLYDQPDTVIGCLKKAEEWINKIREEDKDTPILLCLDSLAGQSSVEENKEIGEFSPTDGARRAMEVGQGLRQLRPILMKNKVCFIVINQTRINIGTMYGDNTAKSGGGKSLEFWCDVSLITTSNKTSDVLKDEAGNIVGMKGTIKNKKNKTSIPFRECEFKVTYNVGLERTYGILPIFVAEGKLDKKGGWYCTKSGRKFQESEFIEGKVTLNEILTPPTV